MIGALIEVTGVISLFLLPYFVDNFMEYKKKEKLRKQREIRLIHEMELEMTRREVWKQCDRYKDEQNKARIQHSLKRNPQQVDKELERYAG